MTLKDKYVCITRADDAFSDLRNQLEARGALVLSVPLLEIQYTTSVDFYTLHEIDWLFFTSRHGVAAFLERCRPQVLALGLKVACVGESTAKLAQELGLKVDFVPEQFNAESAAKAFIEAHKGQTQKVMWLCGSSARASLKEHLEAAGHSVHTVQVYTSKAVSEIPDSLHTELLSQPLDWLLFTSPLAVSTWKRLGLPLKAKIACIGPVTAQAVQDNFSQGLKVWLPEKASVSSLLDCMERAWVD